MNNREIFEVAEIEVIAFDAEDIIRTSTGDGDGNGNYMPGGENWTFSNGKAVWNA